jgi:hypothetical protein
VHLQWHNGKNTYTQDDADWHAPRPEAREPDSDPDDSSQQKSATRNRLLLNAKAESVAESDDKKQEETEYKKREGQSPTISAKNHPCLKSQESLRVIPVFTPAQAGQL